MLYAHQKEILEKNSTRIILSWATSLGKTLALIKLVEQNNIHIPLIICPKSLKKRWEKDMPKANVMTKEEFRRDWKKVKYHQVVIVDEIHHFSGMGSLMSKALIGYISKYNPKFVWGASATPYRSTPWNVYRLAHIMGLTWNYRQFQEAFFKIKYLGTRMIWVPKDDEATQTRLANALKKFCDVVSAEQAGMPPEDVFEEELFGLTHGQKLALKDLALEETNPIVKYGKSHQIAQGFMKGDEFTGHEIYDSEKNRRIVELAEEHPSMLIFCRYTLQIKQIQYALENAKHKVYILTGETKNRQEIIEKVAEGEDCILISQTALGEGWEAPRFDFIVFASLPWSFVDYTQCIGRASRVNIPKRRVYLTLTVEDSIDQAVKEALENKQDFQIELYSNKNKI